MSEPLSHSWHCEEGLHHAHGWPDIRCWVDGAFDYVRRLVGVGIWYQRKGSFDHFGGSTSWQLPADWQEHFCCETFAVWECLRLVKRLAIDPPAKEVTIFNDNLALMQRLNWGIKPKKFPLLHQALLELACDLERSGLDVRFCWSRRTETGMWFADDYAKAGLRRRDCTRSIPVEMLRIPGADQQ